MHSCDSLFLTSLPLSKYKPYILGQAQKFQSFTPDILSVVEFCSFLFRNVSLLVFLFLEQLPHFMPKCMQFPSLNIMAMCVLYLVVQSCPALCDPLDYSLPCSSVHGILKAKILEWVAIFFFHGILLTQGSNPNFLCLLNCRRILYPLSHQRRPLYSCSG